MNSIYLTQEKELNSFIEHAVDGLTYHQDVSNHCPAKDLKQVLQQKNLFEEIRGPDDEQVYALQKGLESEMNKKLIRGIPVIKPGLTINYKAELNEQQLQAVTISDRPLLVIAGAGTGKTRVITYKASFLIESGLLPNQILLLTFTRKAANEMLSRVNHLLADKMSGDVLGGTFHSFANFALRRYGRLIGLPSSFSIIDTEDTRDIIDLLKNELGISGGKGGPAFPSKGKVGAIISRAKNLELPIADVVNCYHEESIDFIEDIDLLARAAQRYKQRSNLLDFDDLMIVLRDNLRDNAVFRGKLQKSFRYILVDEWQDTNLAQKEIVELLAEKTGKLTVVGDDSQSIYGFRGANFENILRFPQHFSNCGVVKLEQNYRSDQGILNFCNDVIAAAKIGFNKTLFSKRPEGNKTVIRQFADGCEEAEFVVDTMLRIRNNGLDYNDFAVLTRASWHSSFIQAELLKRGIPYVVIGGIKFAERRHIRDVVALMRLTMNPLDIVSWHRVMRLIDGVGQVRTKELVDHIHKNGGAIDFSAFSKKKYYPALSALEQTLNKIIGQSMSVSRIVDILLNYYKPILQQVEHDHRMRMNDLDVFAVIAGKYDELQKFLTNFALDPPSNQYQEETVPMTQPDAKPMVISTIHGAKGAEWHTVFLPHALDGLIPSTLNMNTLEELEEERRLFYVGCSRAMKNLFVTLPAFVPYYNGIFTHPSRFLYDVDKKHYTVE
jgi:DNA helicase II / ATP-dependent DNA helicase PcrA